MPSSPASREEVLEILKYLRNHGYIRGITSVRVEKIGEDIGWDEPRVKLALDSCFDQGCIDSIANSAIHITPVGLKALLQAGL